MRVVGGAMVRVMMRAETATRAMATRMMEVAVMEVAVMEVGVMVVGAVATEMRRARTRGAALGYVILIG